MLTVISPAKTLDFESQPITTCHTQPKFLAQSQALIDELKQLSAPGIATLMKLSDKLAGLEYGAFPDLGRGHLTWIMLSKRF
jgi:cytoplasmic iron level regulating protein YaaA (DUF328/UPF0246 family)